MTSILVDQFVSTSDFQQLNEHAVTLLSQVELYKSQGSADPQTLAASDLFEELYGVLKPFVLQVKKRQEQMTKKNSVGGSSTKSSSISESTIRAIGGVLKKLKDSQQGGEISSDLVVPEAAELQKLILHFSLVAVLLYVGQELLQTTLPISEDIDYYDRTLGSRLFCAVYTLQMLPTNTVRLLDHLYKMLVDQQAGVRVESKAPDWIPEGFRFLYRFWAKWIQPLPELAVRNVSEFVHSPANYIVNKQKRSQSLAASFISNSVGLPYAYSVSQLTAKRQHLTEIRDRSISKMGYLIDELVPAASTLDLGVISKLAAVCKEGELDPESVATFSTISEATSLLYNLASTIIPRSKLALELEIRDAQKPSGLQKYWIVALLAVAYIPGLVRNVLYNREAISEWVQKNLVDTVTGFWNNWVVQPVRNVLGTIRHDDDSRIAVMSKQSLSSDLESLERMVVDYCVDNYAELKNGSLSDAQRSALIGQIQREVKSGDMHLVMQIYEDNMKSPVKSLVSGSMVRNLLIQIQKTKVDGAVALSGIDKILQSQELVFGLVAASPACLVAWYALGAFKNYLRNGYLVRFSRNHRESVVRSMGTLERLVDLQVCGKDKSSYYNNGLMYIELITLRAQGVYVVPSYLRSGWIRDLNDVMAESQRPSLRLATIQRIWNTYGTYIR